MTPAKRTATIEVLAVGQKLTPTDPTPPLQWAVVMTGHFITKQEADNFSDWLRRQFQHANQGGHRGR